MFAAMFIVCVQDRNCNDELVRKLKASLSKTPKFITHKKVHGLEFGAWRCEGILSKKVLPEGLVLPFEKC